MAYVILEYPKGITIGKFKYKEDAERAKFKECITKKIKSDNLIIIKKQFRRIVNA